MINILSLDSNESTELIIKNHINKSLADIVSSELALFEDIDYIPSYFPKWFNGDKMSILRGIVNKFNSKDTQELNILEKYVLYSLISSMYEDTDCDYSLDIALEVIENDKSFDYANVNPIKNPMDRLIVINSIIEEGNKLRDTNETISDYLTNKMRVIEDLSCLCDLIFEDIDFELLDELTSAKEVKDYLDDEVLSSILYN